MTRHTEDAPSRGGHGMGRAVAFTAAFGVMYFTAGLTVRLLATPSMDGVCVTILADLVLLAVSAEFYLRHYRGRLYEKSYADPVPAGPWYALLRGAWAFFIWYALEVMAAVIIYKISDAGMAARSDAVAANPGAYAFLALVMAPLTEELFMRGVVLNLFREARSCFTGVLVSSVLFAVLHGAFVYLYVGLMMGFLLAIIYLETGRLRWPVLAHCAMNALSLVLPQVYFDSIWFAVVVGVINAFIVRELWNRARIYSKVIDGRSVILK